MKNIVLLTKREKDYLIELLNGSWDSLVDLERWKTQDIMTQEEIAEEKQLILDIKKAIAYIFEEERKPILVDKMPDIPINCLYSYEKHELDGSKRVICDKTNKTCFNTLECPIFKLDTKEGK